MTYERQRDAIREQVALATMELDDARYKEAYVEADQRYYTSVNLGKLLAGIAGANMRPGQTDQPGPRPGGRTVRVAAYLLRRRRAAGRDFLPLRCVRAGHGALDGSRHREPPV